MDESLRGIGWRGVFGVGERGTVFDRWGFISHSCRDGQVGAIDQDGGGGRRREVVAGWEIGGFSKGFGPIHDRDRRRERDSADARWVRYAAEWRARLGVSGGVGIGDGVLVVSRFKVDCVSAIRHEP